MTIPAHRMVCPVQGQTLHIDLPADFADLDEIEVILMPRARPAQPSPDSATTAWLRDIWAADPHFPERAPDLPPVPVAPL